MKIHGPRPDLGLQKILFSLHPVFRAPSFFAVRMETAQRLSREPLFKNLVNSREFKTLDQLGDRLVKEKYLPIDRDRSLGLSLFARFVVEEKHDYMTTLISESNEDKRAEKKHGKVRVLLQGQIYQADIRTLDQHMSALRKQGNIAELMSIAGDPGAFTDCALYALDSLTRVPGLQVQKFLLDLAKTGDERRSLRALHSLAVRGEAHDLLDPLLAHGNRLIDRILGPEAEKSGWEEFDLYLVMRSLTAVRSPDCPEALELFRRLNPTNGKFMSREQAALIKALRDDDFKGPKWMAAFLMMDRTRGLIPQL